MRIEIRGVELDPDRRPFLLTSLETGETAVRADDTERPGADGVIPGADRLGARTWTIEAATFSDDDATARQRMATLTAAWEPVSSPVDLVPMRYEHEGAWRRVYGRPRRFVETDSGRFARWGAATALATFDVTDPLHYADTESSVGLGIVPASSALLRFPTAPPFRWTSEGAQTVRGAVVGGTARTPVTARFFGPVSRPWVRVGGVLIQVLGNLAYDQQLVIDGRRALVTRGDETPWSGMLSPATRLSDLRLAPGVHEVVYGGTDVTGTSRVEVAWRDAWRSL
ncbi:phage tail family protein [Cellulomonas sp. ACRRI]|uniref:phage tail family protein n=1 Tax=Cellulomonas sp. ACRRI TaxID=2918188 RepID=UPI001EF2BEFE|nr:phage tail family protein [Cellulomonas sp. ACRRI]MCG7284956.1 phage tail family protein [Cellulomonas sp. ACRRI]